MPDELDRASDIEMAFHAEALANVLRVKPQEFHVKFDGENCVDCDMPIPPARLQMKRVRCVACQEALDRRARR